MVNILDIPTFAWNQDTSKRKPTVLILMLQLICFCHWEMNGILYARISRRITLLFCPEIDYVKFIYFSYDEGLILCLWQQFKNVVDIWFMALAAVCGTEAHGQEMSWPSKWEFGPTLHNPHSSQACWTIVPVLRDKKQQIMELRRKYLRLLNLWYTFILQAHTMPLFV